MYIGTENEILRIPVDRCKKYKDQISCLRAKDPYCGWNTNQLECSTAPDKNPRASNWIQEVMGCPKSSESGKLLVYNSINENYYLINIK